MALIGIFIVGLLAGAVSHNMYIRTTLSNDRVKTTYLKEYISELEANAKRARKKQTIWSRKRNAARDRASRSTKGTSKA